MSNQDFSADPVITDDAGQTVPETGLEHCQTGAAPCCNMRPVTLALLGIVGLFLGGNVALLADPSLARYLPELPGENSLMFARQSSGSCSSSSDLGCPLAAAALANCSAGQSSCSLTTADAPASCCETASRASLTAFNCCASASEEVAVQAVLANAPAVTNEDAEAIVEAFDELPPAPALPEKL